MDDESREIPFGDEDMIPLAPEAPNEAKSCPVCFARMALDSPVCLRCSYDERLGPTSSEYYERITSENRYGTGERSGKTCRSCGYDLRGLPDNVCPECGAAWGAPKKPDVSAAAVQAASRVKRVEEETLAQRLRRPAILLGIGLGTTLLIYGSASNGADIGMYLARLGVRLPVVVGVYLMCAIVWIGFDEPLHITIARLVCIVPFVDMCGVLGYGFALGLMPAAFAELLFIHRWVQVIAMMALLKEVMDIDFEDAILLAMVLVIVITAVNMMMIGGGGPVAGWPPMV